MFKLQEVFLLLYICTNTQLHAFSKRQLVHKSCLARQHSKQNRTGSLRYAFGWHQGNTWWVFRARWIGLFFPVQCLFKSFRWFDKYIHPKQHFWQVLGKQKGLQGLLVLSNAQQMQRMLYSFGDTFLAWAQHFSQGSNPGTSCKRCREDSDAFIICKSNLLKLADEIFGSYQHTLDFHACRVDACAMFGPRNELLHESWTLLG